MTVLLEEPSARHESPGDMIGAASSIVTDELVEAVYANNCKFGVPGSAEIEKIRIRRVLMSAAPLLLAALTGNNRSVAAG